MVNTRNAEKKEGKKSKASPRSASRSAAVARQRRKTKNGGSRSRNSSRSRSRSRSNKMMTKKAETETKAKGEGEGEGEGEESAATILRAQKFAFALTYVVYIFVYFTRKPFAIFKTPMREDMRMSEEGIGTMDSLFLAAYASSQFSVGIVSAKLGVRTALSLALLGSGVCAIATGQTDSQWTATALWTANGAFQAACFPLIMQALSPWFSSSVRGKVFGVWTTSQQVGGVLSTSFAGYMVKHATWRKGMVICGISVLTAGVIVAKFLPIRSKAHGDGGKTTSGSQKGGSGSGSGKKKQRQQQKGKKVSLLNIPGLIHLGAAYFFVKLVRYILMNWLPTYMGQELGYSADSSAYMSNLFDVGGVLGSLACGYISDSVRPEKRVHVIVSLCVLTGVSIAAYGKFSALGVLINGIVMFAAGFAVSGPDSVLGGAATSDACEKAGATEQLVAAAGFVNGMGSLGSIMSGILPVYISKHYGWDMLFYTSAVLSFCAAAVLTHSARKSK
eukprot:g2990.t1